MMDKLAEPNLTKRLDLLAEAQCDDPTVREHLMAAKAQIERLQAALLSIAQIPREPPAARLMRNIANVALQSADSVFCD
jgi:hypothetical protein